MAAPRVLAIGTANPPFRFSQREIYEYAAAHVDMYRKQRVEQIFMTSDIDYRHLSFDLHTHDPHESADQMHDRFAQYSVAVSKEAIARCLDQAGCEATDIDYIVAVSCTGYLCPGLSALLIKELGMRGNLQRADLVGMGCAGAMPGLQRAYEYVQTYPERKALVVAVEICSACYYVDESLETVVGNAICGDGAAAALVGFRNGDKGPELLRFTTLLETSFIDTVGFRFKSGKLRIILSKDIRDVAGGLARQTIDQLLSEARVKKEDIRHWVIHSGGRKVIDSIKEVVGLTETQLQSSRCVLQNYGNMSSPTILFVLQETARNSQPQPGDLGVLLAMGPGLAVEAGLLRW